ncbi:MULTISPECIES: TetR/AcrR family transcriptional regulator [unclassified Knoellia]|uniref:TetR/AcrR family transcriptional regulator n=1 Tax=Knoellia altitudinis TaxID=3404795 RepID=UPI003607B184
MTSDTGATTQGEKQHATTRRRHSESVPAASGGGDIDVSLAIMWGMREQATRGRKASITLGAIVSRAVEVADAEGLDAVSMRRLAADLGVGTMSLYRHVPGKSELLDLMIDHVNAVPDEEPPRDAGWRKHLEECARGSYRNYLKHAWLLQVDQSRPLLGPNALAGLELFLGGLDEVDLTGQQKMMVIMSLDAYVTGLARQEVQATRAEQRTGVSDEEFWTAQSPVLERAMSTDSYPVLASLPMDAFAAGWEETFDLGLTALLDGLEARLARSRS